MNYKYKDASSVHKKSPLLDFFKWLRELDLNQRPSGYEPDELPDCSIPRYSILKLSKTYRQLHYVTVNIKNQVWYIATIIRGLDLISLFLFLLIFEY